MRLTKLTSVLCLFVAISAAFLFSSCEKQSLEPLPPKVKWPNNNTGIAPSAKTLKSFFANNRVKSQFFTVNVSSYQRIKGAQGTVIDIPAGSLLDPTGVTVTGNVQFELKEIYSKGDMILSNATTTSNGKLLQSGGEIYLAATQGTKKLHINPATPLLLNYPTNTFSPVMGMSLFKGKLQQNASVAADSIMNWTPVDTAAKAKIGQDSAFGSFGTAYGFTLDSMGWSNCDRFYGLPGGNDPQIKLPLGFDDSNCSVFMIFDSENVVATADLFANQICRFHSGDHTPVGLNVTIVVISKKDDKFYYDLTHEVTAMGAVFNVNPTLSTEATIKAALKAL